MIDGTTIEINGQEFEIPKPVFDLIIDISVERDQYHHYLKFLHELQGKKYPVSEKIEAFIIKREEDLKRK